MTQMMVGPTLRKHKKLWKSCGVYFPEFAPHLFANDAIYNEICRGVEALAKKHRIQDRQMKAREMGE